MNTIDNCSYEAFLTYKEHLKGDNNIYGVLGTKIHDTLEEIINGKNTTDALPGVLKSELEDLEMFDLNFPKDRQGGDSIKDSWIADMSHFCKNFIPPKGKFETEQFVLYKVNDNRYVQGYVDLIRKNVDGTISIYDWKTSSQFSNADLQHHGRQLVFYALAKQQEGFQVKEVAWIMLKYCEITFLGKARKTSKEKTTLTKVVNRGKIVKELKPYIEQDLTELGYDEVDIEIMLDTALKNNEIPQEVADKYTIKPYVRKYDLTQENIDETLEYINTIADKFESEEEWKPREFTRLTKTGKESEDTFYCNTLCNYRKKCKFIKDFNEKKDKTKTDDSDLF